LLQNGNISVEHQLFREEELVMIDWIKSTKPLSEKVTENRHRPFHLSKVHLNQVPTSINDLALLFIAGSV
jgi:hypothetical protein